MGYPDDSMTGQVPSLADFLNGQYPGRPATPTANTPRPAIPYRPVPQPAAPARKPWDPLPGPDSFMPPFNYNGSSGRTLDDVAQRVFSSGLSRYIPRAAPTTPDARITPAEPSPWTTRVGATRANVLTGPLQPNRDPIPIDSPNGFVPQIPADQDARPQRPVASTPNAIPTRDRRGEAKGAGIAALLGALFGGVRGAGAAIQGYNQGSDDAYGDAMSEYQDKERRRAVDDEQKWREYQDDNRIYDSVMTEQKSAAEQKELARRWFLNTRQSRLDGLVHMTLPEKRNQVAQINTEGAELGVPPIPLPGDYPEGTTVPVTGPVTDEMRARGQYTLRPLPIYSSQERQPGQAEPVGPDGRPAIPAGIPYSQSVTDAEAKLNNQYASTRAMNEFAAAIKSGKWPPQAGVATGAIGVRRSGGPAPRYNAKSKKGQSGR